MMACSPFPLRRCSNPNICRCPSEGAGSCADTEHRWVARLFFDHAREDEAILRINESLDFGTVLQGVLDSARSLTGARYGVITLLDDAGLIKDYLYSGLTSGRAGRSLSCPTGCCSSST